MNSNYPAWFGWKPAAWLRVTGVDTLSFLQGQFTNNLLFSGTDLPGAVYGLWLNQKGRVLADSFVLGGPGGVFWVGSYFSPAAAIRERLEAYVIADDVTVEDCTGSWSAVTLFGREGNLPGEEIGSEVQRFSGRRSEMPCTEWVFPSEMEEKMRALVAGALELDAAEMERRRIGAGVPAVPRDIGPTDLPNEGGLEQAAISFTKGCYLGQEVMARLKTKGRLRRRLMRVRGTGEASACLAPLYQAGKKIGEVRSVAPDGEGFVGLAMLTLLDLRGDMALSVAPDGAANIIVAEQL